LCLGPHKVFPFASFMTYILFYTPLLLVHPSADVLLHPSSIVCHILPFTLFLYLPPSLLLVPVYGLCCSWLRAWYRVTHLLSSRAPRAPSMLRSSSSSPCLKVNFARRIQITGHSSVSGQVVPHDRFSRAVLYRRSQSGHSPKPRPRALTGPPFLLVKHSREKCSPIREFMKSAPGCGNFHEVPATPSPRLLFLSRNIPSFPNSAWNACRERPTGDCRPPRFRPRRASVYFAYHLHVEPSCGFLAPTGARSLSFVIGTCLPDCLLKPLLSRRLHFFLFLWITIISRPFDRTVPFCTKDVV